MAVGSQFAVVLVPLSTRTPGCRHGSLPAGADLTLTMVVLPLSSQVARRPHNWPVPRLVSSLGVPRLSVASRSPRSPSWNCCCSRWRSSPGRWCGSGSAFSLLPPTMAAVRQVTTCNARGPASGRTCRSRCPTCPSTGPCGRGSAVTGCSGTRPPGGTRCGCWWDPIIGPLLTLLPAAIIRQRPPVLVMAFDHSTWLGTWYVFFPVDGQLTWMLAARSGLAHIPLALLVAPHPGARARHAGQDPVSPTENTRLAHRVRHLTRPDDDAVGNQASELRRIERNLHDGAQARIVAMGMTLDAAKRMIEKNPEAAKSLMDEAKSSSHQGIAGTARPGAGHPAAGAGRQGIADAIRTWPWRTAAHRNRDRTGRTAGARRGDGRVLRVFRGAQQRRQALRRRDREITCGTRTAGC